VLLAGGLAAASAFAGAAWLYNFQPFSRKPRSARIDQGGGDSGYVSSATCAGCHRDIVRTYRLTGMGRSFYRPTAENTVEDYKAHNSFYDQASDRYYTMLERDGKWYQRRHQIGFGGKETNIVEKQVEYVIGSGNHARTYLYRNSEGNLVEMPVSWYSEKGGYWAMSPGYDRANQQDFRRTIVNQCFSCHNSYPQSAEPGANRRASHFTDPSFSDQIPDGIDCQRCHGPGRGHIEAAGSGKATPETIRRLIVNPARLDRERQLETCLQCHLETTSRMASQLPRYDRAPFSYRPGETLSDYFAYFDYAPGTAHDDRFEIAQAAYRLRLSACFRSSQMTCTTCHDPHQIPRGEEAIQHYVAVCKTCHADTHTARMSSDRMSTNRMSTKATPGKADCLSCHMPKRRTDDAVHVVMTDHYIQRNRPARDLLAPLQEADFVKLDTYRGEVIPYDLPGGSKEPDRQLYLDVAQVQDSVEHEPGVLRMQQDIGKSSPSGPEFYFELAEAYEKAGKQNEAIHWYDEALRRNPEFRPATDGLAVALIDTGDLDRAVSVLEKAAASGSADTVALTDLGNAYLKQGKLDAAQQILSRALSVNPDIPDAQNLLGLALAQKQDWAGAEQSFRAAISIQPELAAAHQNLANLLARNGDYAQARYHFEKAIAGEPDNADTRDRYGLLLATTGSYDKALIQLREAVRLNPNLPQVHGDLGAVLSAQAHNESAADEYRRAIQLNPDAYAAHLSLGLILARAGNKTEAREHLAKAALSPDPEIREAAQKALR
jgi:Tfp pilus assembly protein PilF